MNLRLLGFTGLIRSPNIHPAVVHFPLVLVPTSLILFTAGHFADSPGVRLAGRVCLWLALVSAMLAMFTGAMAVSDLPRDPAIIALMVAHRTVAFLMVFTTILAAGWSTAHEKHRPRAVWAFLAVLALDCALVLQAADLGARLVYLHGAAVKPVLQSLPRSRRGPRAVP